jgi:hypothetical protein
MKLSLCCAAIAATLSSALVGCAHTPATVDVPAALQPPSGQQPIARLQATGVQVYECVRKAEAGEGFAWQFRAPEAVLADDAGHVVGRHFAGPSWAADDGSTVVGRVSASSPSPQPGAIPWLLLTAQSRSGEGLLEGVASVQRVQTVGGAAPAASCGEANVGQVERVGYSATYVFWR